MILPGVICTKSKISRPWILFICILISAVFTSALFFRSFTKWIIPQYAVSMVLMFLEAFAALTILMRLKGKTPKRSVLYGFIGGAIYIGFIEGLTLLVNNALLNGKQPAIAAGAVTAVNLIFYLVTGSIAVKLAAPGHLKLRYALCVLLCLCIPAAGIAVSFTTTMAQIYKKSTKMVAEPTGFSQYTPEENVLIENADFYVATDGNDNNDGSSGAPFATLERARDAVRSLEKTGRDGVTVAVRAGDYRVKSIIFGAEDSGTADCPVTYCAYGDGEVVLNGGMTIDPSVFSEVTDDAVLSRLSPEARGKVYYADIKELGITAEDYGRICAIGAYNTAAKYDNGAYVGPIYAELFVNDARCSLARYPDSGWLEAGELVKLGLGKESNGSRTAVKNWDEVTDPESDVYRLDKKLADRINSWQTLDDVWVFGFPKYTWADASSPIGSFDYEKRELSPKFVSLYGYKAKAPYYFFNILEELTSPGEWYLDRDNGIIYLYPDGDINDSVIDLSLSTDPIIKGEDISDIIFRGFTLKGTRSDAIDLTGDGITVENCLIKNIAGNAILLKGSNNLAYANEITRTGKGGIIIDGGDSDALIPGNSKAENNLIHDWSEIYMTYQAAVSLYGIGNVCAHNEIYNSPHEAITYGGNAHTIEYNLIHDVCLISDDAGAIYSGRSWSMYGTVIRYNAVYDLGTPGKHSPQGIYLDDALSGQTVYGNLLVNTPCVGLLIGGGRDIDARNNIVINTHQAGLAYDQRAIDGVLNDDGWFDHCDQMWDELNTHPWQSDAWLGAYPAYKGLHYDKNNTDDPMFAANAACGDITGNVFVNQQGMVGEVAPNPAKYSDLDNAAYKLGELKKLFTDPDSGDYSLKKDSPVFEKFPDFENIPINKIGRY